MTRHLTPADLVYGLVTAADPQFSPDGTRIVFALSRATREAKRTGSQLWLCDRDGNNAQQITWSGRRNGGARWSPDGAHLAFISDRVAKQGIFVLALNGGEA